MKAVLRVPLDRGGEGVAVVADGYWPAKQGRDALKLQWDTAAVEKVDSERLLAQYRELAGQPGARAVRRRHGAAGHARRDKLEAEFVFPYLAHAPMEPLNCTVQLSDGTRRAVGRHPVPGPGRRGRRAACWASSPSR